MGKTWARKAEKDREAETDRVYRAARNIAQASGDLVLYDYQKLMMRRMVECVLHEPGNEVLIEVSRGAGKSEVVADTAFALTVLLPMMYPERWGKGFSVGCYAPTGEQSGIIFDRMKDRFDRDMLTELEISVEQSNGDTFKLGNGSVVKALTAGKDAQKEGFHWDMLILDEDPNIEDEVQKRQLFPMITAKQGVRIIIGTPNNRVCYFYEQLNKLKGSSNAFVFDVDHVIKDRRKKFEETNDEKHLGYERSFKKELERQGLSDSIRSQYYLHWLMDRSMFMTAEQLKKAAFPMDRVHTYPHPVWAGLDLAKENDRSVLTVLTLNAPMDMDVKVFEQLPPVHVKKGERLWDEAAERYHAFVIDWVEWQGDDFPKQVEDVTRILDKDHYPRLEALTIDQTGLGNVVHGYLRLTELGSLINPFNFGSGGQKISDLWTDLQTVLCTKTLTHFPAGMLWSDDHGFDQNVDVETRHFIDEMLIAEKVFRGQMLKVEAPEGKDYHDDYPVSLALANWGLHNTATLKITMVTDGDQTGLKKPRLLTVDRLFAVENDIVDEPTWEGKQRPPMHFKGT